MISQAKKGDYKQVAPLIVQAMEDLACFFANTKEPEMAIPLFEHFFQLPANQYSYENTLVYKNNGQIVGSITGYDGALLDSYREPFLNYISKYYTTKNISLEKETQKGEYYIDTLSVSPSHQGHGIGSKLIVAMKDIAVKKGLDKIGLLVDKNNLKAKQLYSDLDFVAVGEKKVAGSSYVHMQCINF